MKKLVLKTALLIAIIAAVVVILNSMYIRTQGYRNMVAGQETARLDSVPGGLAVVNFGSSHAQCAFDYEPAGIHGFNFALSAQDFYYDYQVARRFKDKYANGCVALIPVSYFSFGLDTRDWPGGDYRYYGILPYRDIRGHNALDYFKYRWCPVLFAGENLKWMVLRPPPATGFPEHPAENDLPAEELREAGSRRARMHKNWKDQPESIYEFNREYLGKLLSFCRRAGMKPVLITTPFPDYYSSYFSPAFKESFRADVEEVGRKYDVPYLDYSNDPTFADNPSFFGDVEHLSEKGSALFTKMVAEKLKSMNLL